MKSNAVKHDDVWAFLDETMEDVSVDLPVRDVNGLLNPQRIHALPNDASVLPLKRPPVPTQLQNSSRITM